MRAYGSSFGFDRSLTPAVKQLIIANVAVFFLQAFLGNVMIEWLAFIPGQAVLHLQVWRFFTYMFLHGGLTHIAFNMFGLWMFGSQVERLWGSRAFLIYYFICGLGGALTYGIFNLAGINALIPMLGASAAIYGILLAYGLSFPDSIILIFMILPMKAKYAVALFGLIELLSAPQGGGVAHVAHLGGMLTGYLFLRWTIPALGGRGPGLSFVSTAYRNWRTRRRIKVVKPDGRPFFHGHDGPDVDQKEIDRILDKISRQGLQSLTDKEQDLLRKAGRR